MTTGNVDRAISFALVCKGSSVYGIVSCAISK